MRPFYGLVVAVALLIIASVLARSGVGRFVLPVVGLVVTVALVALLITQSTYPRTAAGPWTRIIESTAQSADAACIKCKPPAAAYRRYVRE